MYFYIIKNLFLLLILNCIIMKVSFEYSVEGGKVFWKALTVEANVTELQFHKFALLKL